ncbi:hypothetical protein M407DRAFT_75600 [Tulasnella calospora MUT 4182]|uniref:Uncharacterized protein n=1 Tax=Tulasnella calospora MUT 4182 TaxID=1051891 RepID=A0A0C3LVY7_9AGAM|nr:hypothetical protein M407DRAFT_75600 [Tulasnella calospora MUT 4182]
MSAPAQFFVRLQRGIQGGFAPPTPSEVHNLTRSSDDPSNLLIQSAVRPDGTPELRQAGPKSLSIPEISTLGVDDPKNVESRVAELESILKGLPTEQPPGSEDIYGMDIGIMYGSDNLEWANGGPQGCSGGTSHVQPTEEQRKQFKRAVEIIKGLTEGN